MSDPAPQSDRYKAVLRVLVVIFTVAAVGALVLVAVDLAVGRPPSGDAFIAALNSVAPWCCGAGSPSEAGQPIRVRRRSQVQVRLTSTSALRTFELRRDPLPEQWLLAAITDAGAAAA